MLLFQLLAELKVTITLDRLVNKILLKRLIAIILTTGFYNLVIDPIGNNHHITKEDRSMLSRNFFQIVKPGISKRYLLFVAALVWTFAGGMLLARGISFLLQNPVDLWLRVVISIVGGTLFYVLLFSKISLKHTLRIVNLKYDKPCVFSFFNLKSYLMMGGMISLGILLRKSGIVPVIYLSALYVTMGIPLFLSALRFYYYGFNFSTLAVKGK